MRHLIKKKKNFFSCKHKSSSPYALNKTLFFVQFIIVDSVKMTRKGVARAPGTCSVNNVAYYLRSRTINVTTESFELHGWRLSFYLLGIVLGS